MRRSRLTLCFSGLAAMSCGKSDDGDAGADGGGDVDISLCAPENGPFTAEIDNPYLPFEVGAVHVLGGLEGGTEKARGQTTVLDETWEVAGVDTRIVDGLDLLDPEALPEHELFAQAPDGTVCAYGEDDDSDDVLDWGHGMDGHLAAIAMPASPRVGMIFEMFHGPDIVERAEVTEVGVSTTTPAGTFEDTITVVEDGPSIKKYARGIGMIYDDGIELVSYE